MTVLDNPTLLRKLDPSGMLAFLESFPGQCRAAYAIGEMAYLPKLYKKHYENIICAGLGGSAIGADIARAYLADQVRIPIFVNRDYTLPLFAGKRTLLVVSSYSGNTEETKSAYKDALKRGSDIVVITSGGELKKLAYRNGNTVILIPHGFPPRTALGYSFFTMLSLFLKIGIMSDRSVDIKRAVSMMENLRDEKIGPKIKTDRNQAKRIALKLAGRLPVIYSASCHIDAVATRWRGQLAENAKTLSSTNVFPEMNHNEIMGWGNPRKLPAMASVVILRDIGDHPRVARRMDITRKILGSEGVNVIEVHSEGKTLLERMFSLIYIGDFVSFYLAILNKTDPTPIDRIDYLKKELAS